MRGKAATWDDQDDDTAPLSSSESTLSKFATSGVRSKVVTKTKGKRTVKTKETAVALSQPESFTSSF